MRVGEFLTHEVLDPSYVTLPLRATTLEAAAMYALSSSSSSSASLSVASPTTTTESSSTSTTSPQRHRGTCIPGSHKHLGGAYDPTDGRIYGVPANARHILCLSPVYDAKNQVIDYTISSPSRPLPAAVAGLKMKWLRGIVMHGTIVGHSFLGNGRVVCRFGCLASSSAVDTSTAATAANNDDSVMQLMELQEEYRGRCRCGNLGCA